MFISWKEIEKYLIIDNNNILDKKIKVLYKEINIEIIIQSKINKKIKLHLIK